MNKEKELFMQTSKAQSESQMLYNLKRLISANKVKMGYGDKKMKELLAEAEAKRQALANEDKFEESFEVKNNFEKLEAMVELKATIDAAKVRDKNKDLLKNIIERPFELVLSSLTDSGADYISVYADKKKQEENNITQYEVYKIVKKQQDLINDSFIAKMVCLKTAVLDAYPLKRNKEMAELIRKIDVVLGNLPEGTDPVLSNEEYFEYDKKLFESVNPNRTKYEEVDVNNFIHALTLISECIIIDLVDANFINSYINASSILVGHLQGDGSIVTIIDKAHAILKDKVEELNLEDETWKDIFGKVKDEDGIYQEPIHKIKSEKSLIVILRRVQQLLVGMLSEEYLGKRLLNSPRFNKLNYDEIYKHKHISFMKVVALTGSKDIHDIIVSVHEKESGKIIVSSILFHLFICRLLLEDDFIVGVDILAKSFTPHTGDLWDALAQKIDAIVADIKFENTAMFDEILTQKEQKVEEEQ